MTSKIYRVTVTLPDLAAAHAEQEAKVETNSWSTAVKLACDEISKRPHVRGKHIKSAKLFFSVVGLKDTTDTEGKPKFIKGETEQNEQGLLFEI